MIACVLVLTGIGSLIAGICIDPIGEIHNSILIALGEILSFVGALFGIDYHHRFKR